MFAPFSPLYPGYVSPDGKTPMFVEVGADPTATGVDLPPGSIVKFGLLYYRKYGPNPYVSGTGTTQWELFAISVSSAALASKATWTRANPRYYALDYDAGSDSNAGYSDASMTAAGAVAMKTWDALATLVPECGDGRSVVIAIKPRAAGATYLQSDAVTVADLIFAGKTGYRTVCIFASTDFSNTASDQKTRGGVAISGPFTVAAGTTATTITVAGGETIPAEATILGARIRITSGALLDECSNVHSVVAGAGGTITVGQDMTAVPANGVTFVVESPGATFNSISIQCDGSSTNSRDLALGHSFVGFNVCGLRAAATGNTAFWINGPARMLRVAFCESAGRFQIEGPIQLFSSGRTMSTEADVSRVVGFSRRIAGFGAVVGVTTVSETSVGAVSTTLQHTYTNCQTIAHGLASVYMSGVLLLDCGAGAPDATDTSGAGEGNYFGRLASATTSRSPRVEGGPGAGLVAGIQVERSNISILRPALANVGAVPAIAVIGTGLQVRIDGATGSTGNTGSGISLANAVGCTVSLGRTAANTVTGSSGNIALASGAIITHAQAAAVVSDTAENVLIGASGPIPQTLTDGANIATNLAAADLRKMQEYQVTLGGNRTMDAPTNPVDGQTFVYRLKNDTGARTVTWASGAGAFAFGLSIPLVNVVLGVGGANSYDLVAWKYNLALNRHVCVGFLSGYV